MLSLWILKDGFIHAIDFMEIQVIGFLMLPGHLTVLSAGSSLGSSQRRLNPVVLVGPQNFVGDAARRRVWLLKNLQVIRIRSGAR